MSDGLLSFLQGTIPLDLILLVAVYLTVARGPGTANRSARWRLAKLSAAAIIVQGGHFAEEWATGFNELFPELLGLHPWSITLWASFNIVWIGVWCASLVGLLMGWHPALVPIWFLALACSVNGVAHPLLSLATGGYFPGLWTSPIVGVAGVVLLSRLSRFTDVNLSPR